MSQSRRTPVGRASFPNLGKPDRYGKYSVSLLLPKDGKEVPEFIGWLQKAVKEEIIGQAGETGLQEGMTHFSAFKDGDDVGAFKTYRAEYAGHWVLSAGKKSDVGPKPTIVNRHKQPIDPTEVYAGCDIILFIDVYGYTFGHKKSAAIGLQHVLKVNDNEPFTSHGVPVDAAFDDIDLPEENLEGVDSPQTQAPASSAPATQAPAGTSDRNPFAGV